MSIRKRTSKTAKGEAKEAWVVDYVAVEVRQGVHTPDSASITVAKAASSWRETCRAPGLERSTIDAYAQHAKLHIDPFLGRMKLSQISAPGFREFEDKLRTGKPAPGEAEGRARSRDVVRKILTSLGSLLSDAQERYP